MKSSISKRWKWNILRFALVAAIFIVLYKTGQFDMVRLKCAFKRPDLIMLSAALLLLGVLVNVQRWRILLKVQDFYISNTKAIKLTLIGDFFSVAIPGSVSGDIVKAYYLARGKKQKEKLITTIILDRLVGLYTMMLIAILSIITTFLYSSINGDYGVWTNPTLRTLGYFILTVFILLNIMGIIVVGSRGRYKFVEFLLKKVPFHEAVIKIYEAVLQCGRKPGLMLNAIFVSTLAQIIILMGVWSLFSILGINLLTAIDCLVALPICLAINSIPLTPGGLGVGEAGFQGVFLLFGSDKGAELAILYHMIYFGQRIGLGGMVYLFSDFSRNESNITT